MLFSRGRLFVREAAGDTDRVMLLGIVLGKEFASMANGELHDVVVYDDGASIVISVDKSGAPKRDVSMWNANQILCNGGFEMEGDPGGREWGP